MTDLTERIDQYILKARLYPAFLTVFSSLVLLLVVWDGSDVKRLWPLFVCVGGLFFVSNIVRSMGRRIEPLLIDAWGGLPTTRLLRHRDDANRVLRERRRQRLEELIGQRLPSPVEERSDPDAADEHYVAAVRRLIARVREQRERYPRVHEENINYGFRRNMLALRPVALATVVGCMIVDGVAAWLGDNSPGIWIAAATHGLILLAWLVVVRPTWVYQAGLAYAERLFDTLEDPDLH